MVLSRRVGRMRETFPVLIGTLVSQTALNILALVLLGGIIVSTTDLFQASTQKLFLVSTAPLLILLAVLLAPSLVKVNGQGRIARAIQAVRAALKQARTGPHASSAIRARGQFAAVAQLFAWFLQLLACWALFAALGLDHQVAIGAAAACLFAVNVTAVVPATPSNIGIFQLADHQRAHTRASASAPPTRSPTASSCRRSRSRPPSRSASRPWSARASPGPTCACGP